MTRQRIYLVLTLMVLTAAAALYPVPGPRSVLRPVLAQDREAAAAGGEVCAAPAGTAMVEAWLFFGRNIGGIPGVSDQDWSDFLDREVTPHFPDGLTVTDGFGQWRDAGSGRLIREPSKIVILFFDRAPNRLAALAAITRAYKEKFHQDSVLTVLRPACVGF